MTLYIENSKETTKNLLELVNKFSKVEGHMLTIKKKKNQLYFSILAMNNQTIKNLKFHLNNTEKF